MGEDSKKEAAAAVVYGRTVRLMYRTDLNQQLTLYGDASSCSIKIMDLNYRSLSLPVYA